MKSIRPAVLSVATLCFVWSYASADNVARPVPGGGAAESNGSGAEEKEKDFPDFDKVVTKDFKKIKIPTYAKSEFLTLYHDDKTDTLLAVIPQGKLGQNMLISNSISAGPSLAGWMWNDQLVRFERRDKKLLVVAPDVLNEGKSGSALSDAVRRTYTDRIIETLNIKTLQGGDPVIDLGDLFKKDFGDIGGIFGGQLDSSLAKWTKTMCFEENIVVTVESPIIPGGRGGFFGGGGAKGQLVAVNYNISSVPETGYQPRVADDRVGYFTTVVRDWNKGYDSKSLFKRYVNRWHLEKQDPSLAMSPVKDPIIFYIEKTVPVRFRNAVKEGIEEWNKAFEACGFIDAIQARQQTETEFQYLEPEDVNYNFFRWTAVGNGLARGPSRAHPMTGQIYDADIVFDDSWVRFPIETQAVFSAKGLAATTSDHKLRSFLQAHPEFDIIPRKQRMMPNYGAEVTQSPYATPDYNHLAKRYSKHMCDFGDHLQNEMAMAYGIMEAQGYPEIPEAFIQAIVKDVTMHEVGHTLGLRHNFKASTWLPMDEVLRRPDGERPFCGSVMDYNAFMFHSEKDKQGDWCMTTVGPYDMWAIEYGYRPVADPYKSESELLDAVTDRVAENGLAYATDEDTGMLDPDPLVNRRDMGSDPLEYARYRIELVKGLMSNMDEWAVQDGESYSRLRKRFSRLIGEVGSVSGFAGRYIGGQYFHRDHKGDPNARDPFVPVSAAKQREAMAFVSSAVLSGELFDFDPQLLNKLAPGRWGHWSSDEYDVWIDYDIHDRIESVMRMSLFPLFNPFTINRLYNMQLMYSDGEEAYTLAEHMQSLTNIVWQELDAAPNGQYSETDPFISSARRGLQRGFTQQMVYYVVSRPGSLAPADAHALIRLNCERLHGRVDQALKSKSIDDTSRAHLSDVKRQLRKALDADYIAS